jgi:hypothetical protein
MVVTGVHIAIAWSVVIFVFAVIIRDQSLLFKLKIWGLAWVRIDSSVNPITVAIAWLFTGFIVGFLGRGVVLFVLHTYHAVKSRMVHK